MEYASTIGKLREELNNLKGTLTLKTKEEERLKDQVKALEEKSSQISSYLTVIIALQYLFRNIRRRVKKQ